MPSPQSPLTSAATIALSLVTLAVAWSSANAALVASSRFMRPELAMRLAPTDSAVVGRFMEKQLEAAGGNKPLSSDQRRHLITALANSPLSRVSLRVLAVDADNAGNRNKAREVMALSNRVSRRDLPTQVWLARDAAMRNDLEGTANHLDAALSTKPNTRPQLFGMLVAGLPSREFRVKVADLLKSDRSWGPAFIDFAIASPANGRQIADLLRRSAPLRGGPQMRALQGKLVAKLVSEGDVAGAIGFARSVLGAKPDQLSDVNFTSASTDPVLAPLTWLLAAQGDIVIQVADEALLLRVETDVPTSAATRTLLLSPGNYGLTQSVAVPESGAPTVARWFVSCARGNSLDRLVEHRLQSRSTTQTINFSVPLDCPAVRLDLVVQANDSDQHAEIELRNLRLKRA